MCDALDPRTVSNYFRELAIVVAWMRWCIRAPQCCCKDRSWAEGDFVREPRVPRGPELVILAHDVRPVRGRDGVFFCVGCRMLTAGWGSHEEEHVQNLHTVWGVGDGGLSRGRGVGAIFS